ncbi:unnamed protein product [Paramecium sonneborni]|uniref:Uncharacterized protein n=1 Tax=Paramecium sonneborni TaxID=65129 RepID=A0A8S1PY34_9CILI|nr:unnamed protein product [Paramecium sonneborni]
MLTIRDEGPYLVQELDVSLEQDNAIIIDESDLVILIPEDQLAKTKKIKFSKKNKKEQNKLQIIQNMDCEQIQLKKEKKKQKLKNIQCKNKFFKDMKMVCPEIIQNNELNKIPLKFGKIAEQSSNESKAFKSMMEHVQQYKEQVNWSNRKDHIQIPEKLLKDEIQDIEVFIPKMKGINDSICSNTLYLNKIKDKKLHISSSQECNLDIQHPQSKQRDTYLQYLKDIQMNRIISQNKQIP